MESGAVERMVRRERRGLPARVLVAAAAAAGLAYYHPGPGSIAPAVAIGSAGYVAYAVVLVLGLLPRLGTRRGKYFLALVDAAGIGAVLYASRGVATPVAALMPLAAVYYGGVYGYGTGLATAAVLSVGFIVTVVVRLADADTGQAVATQVPVLFLLALVAGYASHRREQRPASAQAPAAGSTTPAPVAAAHPGTPVTAQVTAEGPTEQMAVALPATPDGAASARSTGTVTVGDISVDSPRGQVFIAGRAVTLSPTEIQLLQLLAEQRGVPLGHDVIRERLWGTSSQGQGNVVDVTIHRLRRKLERQGFPGYILTVRGKGYMLGQAQGSL